MGLSHLGLNQLKDKLDAGECTLHCYTNDLGWGLKRNAYILEGVPGESWGTFVTREVWEYAIKAGNCVRNCQTPVEMEVKLCFDILAHADVDDDTINAMIAKLKKRRKERRKRIDDLWNR